MSRQRQGNESSIIFSEGENKSGIYILPESQRYGYENIRLGLLHFTRVIAFKIQTDFSTDVRNT